MFAHVVFFLVSLEYYSSLLYNPADLIPSYDYVNVTSNYPIYRGPLADVSDRYNRYYLYRDSAADQGVAVYGLGDARNEDAAYKVASQPNSLIHTLTDDTQTKYASTTHPSKTFSVFANVKWNPSDFAIREGEYYNISVSDHNGTQLWNDGDIAVDALGYPSYYDPISDCYIGLNTCRSYLKKRRRLPDVNWMALSCAVGQYVRPLTETELGKEEQYRFLPLDESELIPTLFYVGDYIEFRAVTTGQLICFANDAYTLYFNNAGSLNVTVTRVSWPPRSDYMYQDMYLPACDSSQVIYANIQSKEPVKCNPNGGGTGWTTAQLQGL